MPSEKNSKRRICGLAAASVTALGTLLGAAPASAQPPERPPGQELRELRAADPGTSASYFFKQGWPVKWEESSRQSYDWWQKIEP
ncbi:MAG: hypothetical protein ACLGI2_13980 [Acidimicrobiia bacterium]